MSKKDLNTTATGLSTMASSIEFIDNYNGWMIQKLRPYLGSRLLEIGTGQGNFRKYFLSVEHFVSVDIDPVVTKRAAERFPEDVFIVADISGDEFLRKISGYVIDTVICANVIEHIENDDRAIGNLLSALRSGGYLFIFVPAFPFLYNDMDRMAGHYRRYTKGMMRKAVGKSGQIVALEYFNPVGGLGWWVNKFIKHNDLDSKGINSQVVFFDKYMVPLSRIINPLTKGFFGQSLICVIKKEE